MIDKPATTVPLALSLAVRQPDRPSNIRYNVTIVKSIINLLDTMLTKKKFKDFFHKNVAVL